MQLLFEQKIKHLNLKNAIDMKWHTILIRWAFTTSFVAYNFLRHSFFLRLPHIYIYTLIVFTLNLKVGSMLMSFIFGSWCEKSKTKRAECVFIVWWIESQFNLVYNRLSGQIVGFCWAWESNWWIFAIWTSELLQHILKPLW